MEVVLLISNLLTPGDKVEVTKINKQGEKGKIKTYYSKIYDIIDDKDILKIAMPVLDTKIVLLGMNMNYELYIINDNGMYQCQGTLIERYREKNLFVAVIQLYTKLEKVQRRQFYRLETNIDVKYKLITKDEISEFHEATTAEKHNEILDAKEYINGITIDISGGGLRLTSDRAHVRGEYIVIEFPIIVQGQRVDLSILSEIVLTEKIPDRMGLYEHRLSYINISNKDRENLIKFIFEEERRYRKNEKG